MKTRTLNLGSGALDTFGTDRLDIETYGFKNTIIFDLDSKKPLPYKNDTFDEIRFYETIQLIKYPQEILEECHRILKSQGLLDIKTLNSESPYWMFVQKLRNKPVRFGKAIHNHSHTFSIFNETMMIERLQSAGFMVTEVTYFDKLDRLMQIKSVKK